MRRKSWLAVTLSLALGCSAAEPTQPASRSTVTDYTLLVGKPEVAVLELLGRPDYADRDGVWTYNKRAWNPVTRRYDSLEVRFRGGKVTEVR